MLEVALYVLVVVAMVALGLWGLMKWGNRADAENSTRRSWSEAGPTQNRPFSPMD